MDVGTVQSPAVNVTMPGQKAGTPVPAAESKPLAPMQVPIGANGLDSAAGTGVPAFAPALSVYSRATLFRHPIPPYFADSRVRNAERSMFIPPKVSRGE